MVLVLIMLDQKTFGRMSFLTLLYCTKSECLDLAFLSGIIWIYWMGIRIIRKGGKLALDMIPIMVGMTCFLIANATNEYLIKFDSIWVIFLPITLINYWLIANPKHQ